MTNEEMDEIDESGYGWGWAFFKGGGAKESKVPLPLDRPAEYQTEWMKGFAAAMADYGIFEDYPDIRSAMIDCGIEGEALETLLAAADRALDTQTEWMRWPSVPVRAE